MLIQQNIGTVLCLRSLTIISTEGTPLFKLALQLQRPQIDMWLPDTHKSELEPCRLGSCDGLCKLPSWFGQARYIILTNVCNHSSEVVSKRISMSK